MRSEPGFGSNQENAKQRRILVVGLGKTGMSCIRHLRKQGANIKVLDSRFDPPGIDEVREHWPELEVKLGVFAPSDFDDADEIVLSPGVALSTPAIKAARERGVPCYGDVEIFVRLAQAPIIAVTGSNGKSTVATLVADMIAQDGKQVALGGNIGIPVLDLLAQPVPDYYVLELSSFQLETTQSLRAHAVVVLNISADHMDRYDSLEDYAQAKFSIYAHAKNKIINVDDPVLNKRFGSDPKAIRFGLECHDCPFTVAKLQDRVWIKVMSELWLASDEIRISGLHNISNVLASIALASTAGVSKQAMLNSLRKFPGLPHRAQWVAEQNQVRWVNDSKGTNIGATIAAVQGMGRPVVLIAGGQGKGQDFTELKPVLSACARAVVLIGEDAPVIEKALDGSVQIVRAGSLEDAIQQASGLAQPGDVVLLSPACASFDMFRNYEDRGDQFTAAVKALISGKSRH